MFLLAASLFSAPLESGYAAAPRASASADERARAYLAARSRVIEASKQYLGVPYRYGGSSRNGIDCSGLICESFKDALGVTLPRSAAGLYSWTERVTIERAQPGDLLFFRTDNTGRITHVALYLGGRRFIHAASDGSSTGVIYSSLDERYWSNAFAGVGRAFPEAPPGSNFNAIAEGGGSGGTQQGGSQTDGSQAESSQPGGSGRQTEEPPSSGGRLFFGAALAPTWNGFIPDGDLIRGFSSQLFLSVETHSFGKTMVFGLELRPEYDGALGVFRLPITLSWGPTSQITVFAGPVISWGDASFNVDGGKRTYSGGTNWLGTIGVTAAPFAINTPIGEFAPYAELAWQSYFCDNLDFDFFYDLSAALRFSTGLRWRMQINR